MTPARAIISISPAAVADTAILAHLHSACLGQVWQEHEVANILGNTGTLALLAFEKDVAVGFILLRCLAGEGEILNMGVVADARKKGIGSSLLHAAISACTKGECLYVWLEVAEDNHAALHLYQSYGFMMEGKRKAYYRRANGNAIDAHILRLEIKR